MRTYCYRIDEDNAVVRFEACFPMGEAPETVHAFNGRVATRDYQAEGVSGAMVGTENPVKSRPRRPWPITCCASGVHASQAGELRKHFKEHGCPTEVSSDGDPVYTSASHRRKALKCRGFIDRASYC